MFSKALNQLIEKNLLVVHGIHMSDEVQDLVGVTPLVVVPGHDLHEGVGQSDTGAAPASKMEVRASPRKSEETTASSV